MFFLGFFRSVEVIDLVEEDLDYELDVEMDEDDLLGSEEELCGEFWLFNLTLSTNVNFFENNVEHRLCSCM